MFPVVSSVESTSSDVPDESLQFLVHVECDSHQVHPSSTFYLAFARLRQRTYWLISASEDFLLNDIDSSSLAVATFADSLAGPGGD